MFCTQTDLPPTLLLTSFLALSDAEKTVELKPDWSKGYSRLGAAHMGLHSYNDAVSAYKKGLEIDPNNEPLKSGLADAEAALARSSRSRAGPGADLFGEAFGPEMWVKLANDPTTRGFLQQPDFVKMLQDIQKNPNNLNLYLNDQRMMQALGVLLNVKIQRGAEEDAKMAEGYSRGSPERKRPAASEADPIKDVSFLTNRAAVYLEMGKALLTEVCEETKVAELKIKFGSFQMHVKRKIETAPTPAPIVSPTSAPPVPTEPMNQSAPVDSLPSPAKSSAEKISPFTNVSADTAKKLAALEASGSSGYVIVSSPQVGSFRRAKTLKGKKQPPACKEGDVIKEGQIVGFLDQFGTELPVRSDVSGEVLKLLYDDGEAVGYGDPLVAVLPSFHGIKLT